MALPSHGPMRCTECADLFAHRDGGVYGGRGEECRVENNPGWWGAAEPRYLVLGFSKGPRQNEAWSRFTAGNLAFEDLPFHTRKAPGTSALSMRERLALLLQELGLLREDESIDHIFCPTEYESLFASGSLVKCSLMARDGQGYTEDLKKIVSVAKSGGLTHRVIERCASKYLSGIPGGTLVVMLGLDEAYVSYSKKLFSALYTGIRDINELCYSDGSRTWVHVAHPSGRVTDPQFTRWARGETKSNKVALSKEGIRLHRPRTKL